MTVTENVAASYRVNGKTADEWWVVYSELVANRTEIGERCEQARNAWRDAQKNAPWDTDRLWDATRVVQREYELMSARADMANALFVVATYQADEVLKDFLT